MKPVIFLTQGEANLPSVRFRVLPYVDRGQKTGDDISWYRIPKSPIKRISLFCKLPQSHAIVLQKKLLSPFFFKLLKRKCNRIFYDFDDAVWTVHSSVLTEKKDENVSRKNWKRFQYVCGHSSGVIAGNSFLAGKAEPYNDNITILPTPIDTDKYAPTETPENNDRFVVGWMGTVANQFYLLDLMDDLSSLGNDAEIQIISNKIQPVFDKYQVGFDTWSPEKEVTQLNRFTVGLMPLTDDEYSKGKCGFKLLQYMSCGVVPLASAVGFNTEIITHGKDGFLIREKSDWRKYLTILIKDNVLRHKMSILAREKIKKKFSLEKNVPILWQKLKIDAITSANEG